MKEESPRQAADRAVLSRVAGGEAGAFAELYDRLSGPLYTLCQRMLGDPAEAEDVLQETFVTLWRRATSYDASQSSVFGWSVHLARCKAVDHLRARGRRMRWLAPAAPPPTGDDQSQNASAPEAIADAPDAAAQTESNEDAGRVRRLLKELPSEQAQAIELAFFGDLSHHEISARLGQPLGTIKARIRRGLLRLQEGLRGTE